MKRSPTREARIRDEIIVDARPGSEQAIGWYYYLEANLRFPFDAQCVAGRGTSPLRKGEIVTVLAMAPEAECEHEMFVRIRWQERSFAVPLIQLKGKKVDPGTREAIDDWHYWVNQGYTF
jgi:hypothetical protein